MKKLWKLSMAIAAAVMWAQAVSAQNANFDNLVLDDGAATTPELTFVAGPFDDEYDISAGNSGLLITVPRSNSALRNHPFNVQIDAPTKTLELNPQGVLIGAGSGVAPLTLRGYGSAVPSPADPFLHPWILVSDESPDLAHRVLMVLANNGGSSLRMENSGTGHSWQTSVLTNGDYRISLDGSGGHEFRLLRNGRLVIGPGNQTVFDLRPNGNLIIDGTLVQLSDRNRKENFLDVDCQEVLAKLSELPLQSWNYRSDEDSIRHIGPMAQDFHAAFELGMNDTTIATVDLAGVTIAAIQALNERNSRLVEQVNGLREQLDLRDEALRDMQLELQSLKAIVESRLLELESSRN